MMTVKALAGWSVCLASLLILGGCASDHGTAAPPLTHAAPGDSSNLDTTTDALRIGEVVVIEFSGVSDPPLRHEERIKTNGRITLAHIGEVEAAGKTRAELEAEIHKRYVPSLYRQLTVIVRNEGRYFYVGGQVKNPNQFPYLKEMTVTRAINAAGGFTDFAKKSTVLVTRADGRKVTVDWNKAMRDPKLDLPVYPDDTIEVPRRYF